MPQLLLSHALDEDAYRRTSSYLVTARVGVQHANTAIEVERALCLG